MIKMLRFVVPFLISAALLFLSQENLRAQCSGNFAWDSTCPGAPMHFTDLSVAGAGDIITAWEWDFGDGASSNAQNPTHIYIDGGDYNITLIIISQLGCTDTISKVVEVIDITTVSVHEQVNFSLKINPNPVQGMALINFWLDMPGAVNIEIVNMTGAVVFELPERVYQPGDHQIKWDATDLEPGIYFVKTALGSNINITKLIKAK
ncbi:MAG TPA: PKD domain-containing protein [Bacteroidales bacterium]|nr:PKD domain-containing protein [Bacteroidales bacterium]